MKKRICLPFLFLATALAHADDIDDSLFYEYHNRIAVFSPYHITYERIKTDAFYTGVEGWLVGSLTGDADVIGDAELRMGYNLFWNQRDHFTPFAGVGFFKDFSRVHTRHWKCDEYDYCHFHRSRHHIPGVIYGTVGFLYDHEFNDVFNLGFNAKGLAGGPVSTKFVDWGSPVFGLDVALPITFRFGYRRHWDARLEPFNLYMHGEQFDRNYFGFRSTVGYRF